MFCFGKNVVNLLSLQSSEGGGTIVLWKGESELKIPKKKAVRKKIWSGLRHGMELLRVVYIAAASICVDLYSYETSKTEEPI